MQDLILKAVVQEKKVKNFIFAYVANEVAGLAAPCHKPPFEKPSRELLNMIGLTEKDLRDFSSSYYKPLGDKADFFILKDTGTSLSLFLIHYFLSKKDIETYYYATTLLTLKFYTAWYNRSFKNFCNPGLFDYALQSLSPNHMYSQKGSIAGALMYLSRTMADKHIKVLREFDNPEMISKYVYELMNRVKQSFKSFFDTYKSLLEEGKKGFKAPREYEEGGEYKVAVEEVLGERITHKVIENMLVYKQSDKRALDISLHTSGIDKVFGEKMVRDLHNLKYEKDIRTITMLFLTGLTSISEICGKTFDDYVSKLMSIKRTTKEVYFKKSIAELLNKVLNSIGYVKEFNAYSQQMKYQVLRFFSMYIALYIRHIVCGKT